MKHQYELTMEKIRQLSKYLNPMPLRQLAEELKQRAADLEEVAVEGEAEAEFERFIEAYLAALYFSDTGIDTEIPQDAELAPETVRYIVADCRSWWRRYGCYVTTDLCQNALSGDAIGQAGHDFYFTRNGHGVGFWEGHWPSAYREILTRGAHNYGQAGLYLGDDGLIYMA